MMMSKKIKGSYEVLWYGDGQYDLLDIEASGLTKEELEKEIRKEIRSRCIDKNDTDRILNEEIYLLPYEILICFRNIGKKQPDYKKGYEILSEYFDSISDEEKPKVHRALKRVGL